MNNVENTTEHAAEITRHAHEALDAIEQASARSRLTIRSRGSPGRSR